MVCISRTTICQLLDFHVELFDPEFISDTCRIILIIIIIFRLSWLQKEVRGLHTFSYVYLESSSLFYVLEGKINCFLPWYRKPQSVHSGWSIVTEHIPSTASADDNREKSLLWISS